MVFTNDIGEDLINGENNDSSRRQAMRTARCVKILGKGVVKVVHRCDDAKENENLDLSECQLTQVPDAVFLLMKSVTLQSCSLASNLITKIPAKLPINFTLIKELNLSNNRVSVLPGEMTACTQLETINIYVADVDLDTLLAAGSLEKLDLEQNPLNKSIYEDLARVTSVRVLLSPRTAAEWEDLSI